MNLCLVVSSAGSSDFFAELLTRNLFELVFEGI
jgi:hypothetical protein